MLRPPIVNRISASADSHEEPTNTEHAVDSVYYSGLMFTNTVPLGPHCVYYILKIYPTTLS